ncbi:hypothetical protein DMC30DRAFT_410634 [Rhodotorula diobovata]|uniref:Major facilitator superfamily domain-containing protein n=1 Tax=Rhodotorula diobovata TaxID=5288 RepID=A0A5C5G6P2_9BASI|nr:hypothetical protein DMC30DRAFT_410634 [Rhodotorula diobovata]
MYELGLEFFNGSITTLASDRFKAAETFTKLGAASCLRLPLRGVNQAAQCVGAILIAPLVARYPTRTVLSAAVVLLALMTAILLIVDAASGGRIKGSDDAKPSYGNWDPNAIFPIWTIAGVGYGMVELLRRVIPADIVGGNVNKLRRMDAAVHILYEVAGTSGAFASSAAISRFGNNYSFLFSPIFLACAGLFLTRVSVAKRVTHDPAASPSEEPALVAVERSGKRRNYLWQLGYGAFLFCKSIAVGGGIVFGHSRFLWLFPGYSIALYASLMPSSCLFLHRFLESSLSPAFARRVLGTSAWSQIQVGGSNFGELLGALAVFVLNDYVPTPLPCLRLDALMLNLVWTLPRYSQTLPQQVSSAWIVAATLVPVSFGWAAGDVSLAAYIQSSLSDVQFQHKDVSALGAVMAFLFTSHIVLNAVLSSLLGKVIDRAFAASPTGSIYAALVQVGGVQFSVGCAVILAASCIPRGAMALNPRVLNGEALEGQGGDLAEGCKGAGQEGEEEMVEGGGDLEAQKVKERGP